MKVLETKDWEVPSYTQEERDAFADTIMRSGSYKAFPEEVYYMSKKTYEWLMDSIREMENAIDEDAPTDSTER